MPAKVSSSVTSLAVFLTAGRPRPLGGSPREHPRCIVIVRTDNDLSGLQARSMLFSMSQSLSFVLIHIVFSTKARAPLLAACWRGENRIFCACLRADQICNGDCSVRPRESPPMLRSRISENACMAESSAVFRLNDFFSHQQQATRSVAGLSGLLYK
jgi:hypothetical protein